MKSVQAAQLLYTRVEADYSPVGKAGFQTAYKTDGLDATALAAIERRVQCFQPHYAESRRHQFFRLADGSVVVSHTLPIDKPSPVVDRAGRVGAFIAHCLILSHDEFMGFGCDPFIIFERFKFVEDVQTMLERFERASGIAPRVKVVDAPRPPVADPWEDGEMDKIITLARQAESLVQAGQSLLFLGDHAAVYETLEVVFDRLTPAERLHCTFDTHIDYCPMPSGRFWGVGALVRPANASYIQVDTVTRRILSDVEHLMNVSGPGVEQARRDPARRAEPTPPQSSAGYTAGMPDQLYGAIRRLVGADVADDCASYYPDFPDQAMFAYGDTAVVEPAQLALFLSYWLCDVKPELHRKEYRSERDELYFFADKKGQMQLLLALATLPPEVDTNLRKQALDKMSKKDFRETFNRFWGRIALSHFVHQTHLAVLLQETRLKRLTEDETVALIVAALKLKQGALLRDLTNHVDRLSLPTLGKVQALMKRHRGVDPIFETKVQERRQELEYGTRRGPGSR